jgi:hypothetical protein
MGYELEAEGHQVHFVAVNKADATDTQAKLTDKATYPMLQDTDEVGAWALHQGKKDDFFVYGMDGKLSSYLLMGGEIDTNLSKPEGYANVKQAILAALGQAR